MRGTVQQNKMFEAWNAKKMGLGLNLTREQINHYQLHKVRQTIQWAYENSPFYHKLLKNFISKEISCLEDLHQFPFTTADHIREQARQFLCVSQGDISRIVTLDSSGTTGKAKRIYFTAFDQELTIDFFQQGMSTFLERGDRVLILLPGERVGSIGDLLIRALERAGSVPILHSLVQNIPKTLDFMVQERIDSLVGSPTQVLALARYAEMTKKTIQLKSALLSTDHVPDAIIQELVRVWGCQVFEHYGMTEMGLGGGLDCEAHKGYHLREADLYFEVVDQNGKAVPDGQEGEVVFTTLTRQGMPFIRYRTGDISRFLPGPCSCGTVLKRLERIIKRKDGLVFLNNNTSFTISDLDEKIFAVDNVIDFTVTVNSLQQATKLTVSVWLLGQSNEGTERALWDALYSVPELAQARQASQLSVSVKIICNRDTLFPSAPKRRIMELKIADGKQNGIFD
jgi:phenylacetate-CoA ligase